jgi:heterodisulfide reductase subunit C
MSERKETQKKETMKGTVFEASDTDPKFKHEISKYPGLENILLCFQCGTCTADCPVARFSDFYRPRKLIRMIQLGLKNVLLSNEALWLCSTCFTCVDHCPQEVGIAHATRALRNLAADRGEMPLVYKELASNILKTGYAYVIPERRLEKREEELPPLPKASLEDLSKLSDATGLCKMLKRTGR